MAKMVAKKRAEKFSEQVEVSHVTIHTSHMTSHATNVTTPPLTRITGSSLKRKLEHSSESAACPSRRPSRR